MENIEPGGGVPVLQHAWMGAGPTAEELLITDYSEIEALADKYALCTRRRMEQAWPASLVVYWHRRLEWTQIPLWGGCAPLWTMQPGPPIGQGKDGSYMPHPTYALVTRQVLRTEECQRRRMLRDRAAWVLNWWHQPAQVLHGMSPREAMGEGAPVVDLLIAAQITSGLPVAQAADWG